MADLIVLMGPTGAGKSVQGDLLAHELNGIHLSSGHLLRTDPQAAAMIADGKLAPAHEVERIVGEAIGAVASNQPIILDGFPRTVSNLDWMGRMLPAYNRQIVAVILIDLDLQTSLSRLGLRHRADDAPAAVQEKWDEYITKTQPVIDYFDQHGLLKRIDGRGNVSQVQQLVKVALK